MQINLNLTINLIKFSGGYFFTSNVRDIIISSEFKIKIKYFKNFNWTEIGNKIFYLQLIKK